MSGIKIKKSKEGTFTAQATKMGMSVQEAASHILAHKENYSPTMVKKANFAHNAAGFKHMGEGGPVGGPGWYGMSPEILQYLEQQRRGPQHITDPLSNPTNPFTGGFPSIFSIPDTNPTTGIRGSTLSAMGDIQPGRGSQWTTPHLPTLMDQSLATQRPQPGIPDISTYSMPKQKFPRTDEFGAGMFALGSTATAMGNIGQPSVGLNVLGGALKGGGIGKMFGPIGMGVGAAIGGLTGLIGGGLNYGSYTDAQAQRQKDNFKANTVSGTNIGQFAQGGEPDAQEDELTPIQTEKGENIFMEDGHIFRSKAKVKHNKMDKSLITDILPGSAFVASDRKFIHRDKANKMILGYDIIEYKENEPSGVPTERTLGDIMSKKKMTVAEIGDIVRNKFPLEEDVKDPFIKKANIRNLMSRVAYLESIKKIAK